MPKPEAAQEEVNVKAALEEVSSEAQNEIMKNLFYLNNSSQKNKFQNNVATVSHRKLEYASLNQESPKVVVDFIELREKRRSLGNP